MENELRNTLLSAKDQIQYRLRTCYSDTFYPRRLKLAKRSLGTIVCLVVLILFLAGPGLLILLKIFLPNMVPWDLVQWDKGNYTWSQIIEVSKFWILGYFLFNTFVVFKKWKDPDFHNGHRSSLKEVFGTSILAGVWEELFFRWIAFLCACFWVNVANWILGGFLGGGGSINIQGFRGLIDLFDSHILIPIADWSTRGMIHDYLYLVPQGFTWFVIGSAIIVTSNQFRDGHKKYGPVGYIASWFFGMFCFYLTFNYGLVTAIVVHTLLDIAALTPGYIDSLIWPRLNKDKVRLPITLGEYIRMGRIRR